MRPPPSFHTSFPDQVCPPQKYLYGLRQVPRYWFSKLTSALHKYGFTQSYPDYSLFTYNHNNVFMGILIYVDDLLITRNFFSSITKFKDYLYSCFHMKDLGPLKYFLGIEVTRSPSGMYFVSESILLK